MFLSIFLNLAFGLSACPYLKLLVLDKTYTNILNMNYNYI